MPTDLRATAIIPARYASTRFPGKPLATINGKPLIQYVWEAASRASLINRVIIATDDERIFKAVKEFGGEGLMTSSNHATGTDRISEVAKKIKADIIVNVQGDEPLIEPRVIDMAVEPFRGIRTEFGSSELQMGTICTEIKNKDELDNPNVVKVVADCNGFALYFSRYPIPYNRDNDSRASYYKHIGLYVYRKDFLIKFSQLPPTPLEEIEKLEQLRALEHGYKIKVIKTEYNSIGVDTHEDLERVKEILKKKTN
jgi:3-deoxy-manno-octulosonate cytidylyltransferase (CMP-KDO synthetase)